MVRLLSDLCKDRNYLAIDILQKKFPFEICFDIMKNSIYGFGIREVFTSLMKNLWIDVSPYQTVSLPLLIKIWDDIENADALKNIEKKDHENDTMLKAFILKHLSKLKTVAKASMKDISNLDFAILDLTE
jgi:hypothetical protein